jgi:hypothetical protein
VNPVTSYELPYAAIGKVQVNPAGSLIIFPKRGSQGVDTDGCFVVGFAGSLLDRIFKTSGAAAAEIKKFQRKRRTSVGASGPVTRSLVADWIAEVLLAAAAVCVVISFIMRF